MGEEGGRKARRPVQETVLTQASPSTREDLRASRCSWPGILLPLHHNL